LLQSLRAINASRCGSRTGNCLMTRLLRIEKSAVFAPMPSASDAIATPVTTGVPHLSQGQPNLVDPGEQRGEPLLFRRERLPAARRNAVAAVGRSVSTRDPDQR
jgi:hypothetical protein